MKIIMIDLQDLYSYLHKYHSKVGSVYDRHGDAMGTGYRLHNPWLDKDSPLCHVDQKHHKYHKTVVEGVVYCHP